MQYDADYQNEQAVSSVFRAHLDEVAAIIQAHFKGQTLIEVGCGKGYFLEHLLTQGFAITGLDPTYEGDSPHVIKEYFTPEIGLSADGIVLRHVLEHVRDPVGFLRHIRDSNGGAGRIYIEVPSRVRQLNAQVIDSYEPGFKNVDYKRGNCCGWTGFFRFNAAKTWLWMSASLEMPVIGFPSRESRI
jgi:SAM-dependent methyltransferase